MSLDDLHDLPVDELAADDCALFMWATDPMLPEAIILGEAWGFTYKTVAFYWAKTDKKNGWSMGGGYWTRANPEPCLLFTKGKPWRKARDVRKLIVSPRREHSRKPDEINNRIRRLVIGPYIELFSRQVRPAWDAWGDEAGKFGGAA